MPVDVDVDVDGEAYLDVVVGRCYVVPVVLVVAAL
jgi:hypothetical protein